MRIRILKYAGVLLLLYLLASGIAGVFLCEMALHPGKRTLSAGARVKAAQLAQEQGTTLHTVAITASDGVRLKGWYFQGRAQSAPTLLVLHGLSDNRSGMTGYIELFLRNGYNVLAPDSRAHGESGGSIATYGLHERHDVKRWVDWVTQTSPGSSIYGLGQSMGAAILLQSLRVENRFSGIVAEGSFSNFQEIGCDRVSQKIGAWFPTAAGRLVFAPSVFAGIFQADRKYKLDFHDASPESSITKTRTPVLLIHGTKDSNIPLRHAERIATYSQHNLNITYWFVVDGEHSNTLGKHPQEFKTRVLAFFKQP